MIKEAPHVIPPQCSGLINEAPHNPSPYDRWDGFCVSHCAKHVPNTPPCSWMHLGCRVFRGTFWFQDLNGLCYGWHLNFWQLPATRNSGYHYQHECLVLHAKLYSTYSVVTQSSHCFLEPPNTLQIGSFCTENTTHRDCPASAPQLPTRPAVVTCH